MVAGLPLAVRSGTEGKVNVTGDGGMASGITGKRDFTWGKG